MSDGFQRETTKMEPTSPYGCTKVIIKTDSVRHYRFGNIIIYNTVNGILFNHECEKR